MEVLAQRGVSVAKKANKGFVPIVASSPKQGPS